jgi:hypothetical protein
MGFPFVSLHDLFAIITIQTDAMKQLFMMLIVVALCVTASNIFAQKVKICIYFNRTDLYFDSKDNIVNLTPSGFTAADRSAIVNQVQTIYEKIMGKGNVDVKDVVGADCDSGVSVIVDGGTAYTSEYGDVNLGTQEVLVSAGVFTNLGFKGDILKVGIAECIAHEAAHIILGLSGHNEDSTSILCAGDRISLETRMNANRVFTADDSLKFVKRYQMLRNSLAPEPGAFSTTPPTLKTLTSDEKSVDLKINTIGNSNGQIGYMGLGYKFVGGNEYFGSPTAALTTFGNMSANLAVEVGTQVYPANNFADMFVANPAADGGFQQSLFNFSLGGQNNWVYVGATESGSFGPIEIDYRNLYHTNTPPGGDVTSVNELDRFDVYITPKYLTLDNRVSSSEDEYWYPPKGLEIVDGVLDREFYIEETGVDIAYYNVLLSDGSTVELRFRTSGVYPNIYSSISEEDWSPPDPTLAFTSGTANIVDGPITVRAGGKVARYDSTQRLWKLDTAGFGNVYVNQIAGDTSGRIFAVTTGKLFTQLNTSLSWTSVPSFPTTNGSVIFVDRKQRIYAGTSYSSYMSTDHGATWTVDTVGLPSTGTIGGYGGDMIGNVYLIINNYSSASRAFKSDGGTGPWKEISQPVGALIGDKQQGNNFNSISGDSTSVTLCTRFGLFKTTDGGTTWAPYNSPLRSTGFYSIAKNSKGQMFLGTDLGLFSGYYQQPQWSQLFPKNSYMTMSQRPLYIDNNDNLYTLGVKLYASPSFGYAIAHSSDNGVTWSQDSSNLSLIKGSGKYFVDPNGKEYISSVVSGAVNIYSRPKGGTWALDQSGFVPRSGYEYVTQFWNDGTSTYIASVYSVNMGATQSSMIWKYSGNTWTVDTAGIRDAQVYTFAKDNSGMIFAGGMDRILKFSNNQWSQLKLPSPHANNIFYISCDKSGALFATFYDQGSNGNYVGKGVYFTKDQGENWVRVNLGDSIELDGLYSFGDSTFVQTTQGIFAFTSNLWATSYIPEGVHSGSKTVSIDMGSVKVGQTGQFPIRITNFGNTTLSVASAVINNPAFALTNIPGTAAPTQVINAMITFKPTGSGGSAQATIVLNSNSLTQADTIIVTGTGIVGGAVGTTYLNGFSLDQNFPNPFSQTTSIGYTLADRCPVRLELYDALGREIAILASGIQEEGNHAVHFDAQALPTGMYFYRLIAGAYRAERTMSVTK